METLPLELRGDIKLSDVSSRPRPKVYARVRVRTLLQYGRQDPAVEVVRDVDLHAIPLWMNIDDIDVQVRTTRKVVLNIEP